MQAGRIPGGGCHLLRATSALSGMESAPLSNDGTLTICEHNFRHVKSAAYQWPGSRSRKHAKAATVARSTRCGITRGTLLGISSETPTRMNGARICLTARMTATLDQPQPTSAPRSRGSPKTFNYQHPTMKTLTIVSALALLALGACSNPSAPAMPFTVTGKECPVPTPKAITQVDSSACAPAEFQ